MLPPIHVLLADGHPVLLAALAEMTARLPGVVVAGTVATGTELLARLAQTPAGVVLLDADLPPAGGLETTRWLNAAYPAIPVLLLTLDNPLALVKKMLAAGAAGYVPKTAVIEALERAIRTAAAPAVLRRTRRRRTGPAVRPGEGRGVRIGYRRVSGKGEFHGFTQRRKGGARRPQRKNKKRRRTGTGLCAVERKCPYAGKRRLAVSAAWRERAASRHSSHRGKGSRRGSPPRRG